MEVGWLELKSWEKREFNAEGAEYTEDAEGREEKSKKQEEKKKREARKRNERREGEKCAMRERIARALARAAEAAFFVCGKDGCAGKKCGSGEGGKLCEGAESAAEECAAKKESTRRRNSSGSKP